MSCMPALLAIVVSSMFSCYSLDGNGITDKGFGILAKALKVIKSLESLRSVTALHLHSCQVFKSNFRDTWLNAPTPRPGTVTEDIHTALVKEHYNHTIHGYTHIERLH